ncbi:hypothetical protein MVEN_00218900 [Mycena venus]|uniref:7alpha-cephem-methoxylase P8 chain related protein n=1 Tax=Mycena venus TaxID=2733690 RepID=A0A8H6Z155_9AGAR|nr:hypothetical protein MVEN_00218900 [Mycena venus]
MGAPTPSSTTGTLYFSIPPKDGVRAYVNINDPEDYNYTREAHEVKIHNLRGNESAATLDTAGFQLYNHPAKHTAFTNDADIEKEYYPESIELIKKLTGASRVVLFDHTVRRRRPDQKDTSPDKRQPVPATHIDQTNKSSVARVHRHLPADEAPELLKHRFQIINLWRPISHPAVDWPLSLCDFRSVDPEKDVFPVALIYPDREGETSGVKYNPNQKWTYFSGVTPDELILIKCFDSLQDGSVALYTPHTAFADPATPEGTPFRESIELRALVFYD